MNSLTISIFNKKSFLEILLEVKFFENYKIKYYDDLNLCIKDSKINNQLIVFFVFDNNVEDYKKILSNNVPSIFIINDLKSKFTSNLVEELKSPFKITDFKKKFITLAARYYFYKNSLIKFGKYIVDKNERKIKKENLELKLTEKEINLIILFIKNKEPITKKFILKNFWNYSTETDTHTIETHIHRLRKKISIKFGDNNFIKSNKKGYFI